MLLFLLLDFLFGDAFEGVVDVLLVFGGAVPFDHFDEAVGSDTKGSFDVVVTLFEPEGILLVL